MTPRKSLGRRRLASAVALARIHGLAPSRADRFRTRQSGRVQPDAPPSLRAMTRWPMWPLHEEPVRRTIFSLAALLASRNTLAGLVCGSRLRAYAAIVGEEMLERALDWPREGRAPLLAAEDLEDAGRAMAAAELPPSLAGAVLPQGAQGEATPGTGDNPGGWIIEAERLMSAAGRL